MPNKAHAPAHATTHKDFPSNFRRIRLELARESYVLVAPLDATSHLDVEAWRQYPDLCRVVRFRSEADDDIGHLVRRRGGKWAFHYDLRGDISDESGHRLENDRFVTGEYVAVEEDSGMRTFQVASVERVS
jgi:hypothetical protein